MPQKLTPQEKKRKSFELDGRNCYCENSKSSRKAIPRRKALVNRAYRHAANQALLHPNNDVDVLDETVSKTKRSGWKKVRDVALGSKLLDRLLRQIVNRVTTATDPARLLGSIESQLTSIGTPSNAIQDILKQLNGIVRARNSIRIHSGSPLRMNYDMATTIVAILNRRKSKS
jgi:hypothetical protein